MESKGLLSYDEQHERMTLLGYYLKQQSESGSRYYVALFKPYVRVSDHPPNVATRGWMQRNGIEDIRVLPDAPHVPSELAEPELGYHQHPAHSRTMLQVLNKEGSRAFEGFYITHIADAEDETTPMKIGSVTHQQCLEPHLESRIKIIPENVLSSSGSKAGKAWKQWEEENADHVHFKESEYRSAMGCVTSLRKAMRGHIDSPDAIREHALYWQNVATGLPMKAKLDILVKGDDDWYVPDLKTCADLSRFDSQVKNGGLWLQAAHYRAGVKAVYGVDPVFWFAVVESSGVHQVWHYELDEDALAEADRRYDELLFKLAKHYETGDWSMPQEFGAIKLSKRQCFGWSDITRERFDE